MKTLSSVLLLATAPLLSDCFSWEFGAQMGHRNDQLEYTIFEAEAPSQPLLSEKAKYLSTAQIAGFTTLRLWWLELNANANYGWTLGGNVSTTTFLADPSRGYLPASFRSDASGQLWDAFFRAGIHIPFYSYFDRSFSITPLGGYSFHELCEKRHDLRPFTRNVGKAELIEGEPSNPTFVSLPNTGDLKRNYQGPFGGIEFSILYNRFHTTFGYAYHWIDLKQTIALDQTVELLTESALLRLHSTLENRSVLDRNRGNRGWLSLSYQDLCGWRIGLSGTYLCVSTRKRASHLLEVTTGSASVTQETTNPLKTRWQTFTIMLEAAYTF